MVSTYYISKTVYFISQQYIVLQSNLVDLLQIYILRSVCTYLQTVYFISQQYIV
jgi:hypothetical protein